MKKKYVIFLNGEYKYSQEFMDKLVLENIEELLENVDLCEIYGEKLSNFVKD